MSLLRQALADYLSVRRALGSKLDRAEKLLGQFVSYLELQHADVVTVEHAVAWATQPDRSGWWHAMRLSAVRRFAAYLRNIDDRTQIPPPGLIAHGKHRATPYLYSDAEIHALVQAATRLHSQVYAATYPALISVLAVTGMRFGEAIGLDVGDFDVDAGVLTVRDGKFGKSRLLPLHPSTTHGLRHYLTERQQLLHDKNLADSGALFISNAGTRLDHSRAQRTWRKVRTSTRLVPRSGNCRPRMESRPGARFWHCCQPVSPDRSPNPPCRLLGNGLSTVTAVRRGSWMAMGWGSCCPGRRSGRPSRPGSGSTRPRPLRSAIAR